MLTLYTNHCPLCNFLAKALRDHLISYKVVDDEAVLIEKGFTHMPMLELEDGTVVDYKGALKYLEGRNA